MAEELTQIVDDFHSLLFDLLREFYKIAPTSIVTTNRDKVEQVLSSCTKSQDLDMRHKIIDIFVLKVLECKPQIDLGDDSFFLNNTLDKKADGDSFVLGIIGELKRLWPTIKSQNKKVIMEYLQYLCELAQSYFLIRDDRC